MRVLSEIRSHPDAVDCFKKLPFYNKPIEKPKIKTLKNLDQLAELCFYEQLSIIEIIGKKDSHCQLEASKLSIKDFLLIL